jgi:hypothetical protein
MTTLWRWLWSLLTAPPTTPPLPPMPMPPPSPPLVLVVPSRMAGSISEAITTIPIPDPEDGLTIAVEGKEGEVGASVEADIDFGKPGGWSGGGKASWATTVGAAAMGWIKWRPRKK